MAYRYGDPYADQYRRYDEQYADAPGFGPYSNTQPHQPYDQSGYTPYEAEEHREHANHGQSVDPGESTFASGHRKLESANYDQAALAQAATGSRLRDLRRWRREHHGSLWTKGSRGACIGRFCCCTLMIIVFLIVSILLPLALWTRPPNVIIGNIQPASNENDIQFITNGVQINLGIPIYVDNPNFFTISFSSIKANIYYPIDNTLIGSGQQDGVTFHSHSSTNFTFPFSMEYTTTMTSGPEIIADLISRCGFAGGTASNITVEYQIMLALRVLFVSVSPTIRNSASFSCPLTASDISSLIPALGGGGS